MMRVKISDRAFRMLTMLRNWHHQENLDDLISKLAKECVNNGRSAALGTQETYSNLVDYSDEGTSTEDSNNRIVSEWITTPDAQSESRERLASATLDTIKEPDGEFIDLNRGTLEDFVFAKIYYISIDGNLHNELTWAGLIRQMLRVIQLRGVSNIRSRYQSWVSGYKVGEGWTYARDLSLTLQNCDSYTRWKQVADLSVTYNVPVEVKVTWTKKGKYPFQKGLLRVEPHNKYNSLTSREGFSYD